MLKNVGKYEEKEKEGAKGEREEEGRGRKNCLEKFWCYKHNTVKSLMDWNGAIIY